MKRTNPYDWYMLPTRESGERESVASGGGLALGFARGWYSESLAGQSTETVLECAYNWYINDVLTLTPNLQYVLTPGGTGTIDDALILGLLSYITY